MSGDSKSLLAEQQNDNEIDLFELCHKLWIKKIFIASVTILVAAVGIILALTRSAQHRVSVTITPVSHDIVNPGIFLQGKIDQISPEEALATFFSQIKSPEFTDSLIQKITAGKEENGVESVEKTDLSSLSIKKKKNEIFITYENPSMEYARNFLDRIVIPAAVQQTRALISTNLKRVVGDEMARLEQNIALQQVTFIDKQNRDIANIKHALELAKEAGIETPSKNIYKNFKSFANSDSDNLFLLGYKFLQVKLDGMRNQIGMYRLIKPESEILPVSLQQKPLVPGIVNDYHMLVLLKKLQTNLSGSSLVNKSKAVITDSTKSKFIYSIVALIAGLFLGVFLALVRIALENYKKYA